ncbi:hypothetical protein CHARACLAT_020006 [Characodon lateralis]|uniref:EGF-like domain-containing protein n=1 Tax=Characodon lateralis TaxID=208331 RepID=A0ABU7DIM0_9TELE|nr:hypothetical protein [Characodon lateralis]
MQPFTLFGAIYILHIFSSSTEAYRHHRQVLTGTQPGVCRYGRRLECCYGWMKNTKGQCEAQCEHGCKHGECVGPSKCKCFPGYTGKTCNQGGYSRSVRKVVENIGPSGFRFILFAVLKVNFSTIGQLS